MRFSNRRTIAGGSYDRTAPWLAGVAMTPADRAQLLAVVRLFGDNISEAQLLAGDARFFKEHAQAFAESPVEWWDIGDDEPAYQLWVCYADAGFLFAAGQNERLATIIQDAFDLDGELAAEARAAIATAAVAAPHAGTLLARVSFDR